jgi:hypothetical protein
MRHHSSQASADCKIDLKAPRRVLIGSWGCFPYSLAAPPATTRPGSSGWRNAQRCRLAAAPTLQPVARSQSSAASLVMLSTDARTRLALPSCGTPPVACQLVAITHNAAAHVALLHAQYGHIAPLRPAALLVVP